MIRGGRSRVASAGKRKRPVFGGQDSDAVIKFDSRNPVTARKEEAAKKAAAKKAAQAKTDAAVAKRTATQKTERDALPRLAWLTLLTQKRNAQRSHKRHLQLHLAHQRQETLYN